MIFLVAVWREQKAENAPSVKKCAVALAIFALLSETLALAEDFKTVRGKVYKDATIIRVEADGIVLKTQTGISKVYFVELPNDVQQRFHPTPANTPVTQRAPLGAPESSKLSGWAALMGYPAAHIKYFVAWITVIAGVVFLVIRRRSQ